MATTAAKPKSVPTVGHRDYGNGDIGPLEWSGKFAGGLRADLRRRGPLYWSDIKDAFIGDNLQKTTATIPFLFFAALSPAIAFGDRFDEVTNGSFGVVEMILSSALVGVFYALCAGQPLCILGATGPILAFTRGIYDFGVDVLEVEFLPWYFWVTMWTGLFTTILSLTDVCCLMVHVTKFTEEIFAALISIIFLVGALRPAVNNFLDDEKEGETALMELLFMMSTFLIAHMGNKLRNTSFGFMSCRTFISNFAVSIAIFVVCAWAGSVRHLGYTTLKVPSTFRPTYTLKSGEARPWVVNPMGITEDFPVYAIFVAALPAIGFTVLGYLDQNITSLLINRPHRGLRKPPAYHLDLLTRGMVISPLCAILGLPMPVGSTVPTLTHVMSLTTYKTEKLPGGAERVLPVHTAEQRVTNMGIHLLVGLSLAAAPLLRYVPQSVILGIFLYMGVSSLRGNSFFERIHMWTIWDVNQYPQYEYVQKVSASKMHLFTTFELILLGILYAMQFIPATSLFFPFFIIMIAVVRKFFRTCFTKEELQYLDDIPPDYIADLEEHQQEFDEEWERKTSQQSEEWDRKLEKTLGVKVGHHHSQRSYERKMQERHITEENLEASTGDAMTV